MSFSLVNQEVVEQLTERWQIIINMIARHYDVPSCLVMKLEGDEIKVHVSSEAITEKGENPYQVNDAEHFDNSGLYCEHVIKTQQPLQVNNALTDPQWNQNPDIKLGMIAYLGVPINWPDQSPFGTLCVLDRKERHFPSGFEDLLSHLSRIFELELGLSVEIEQRKQAQAELIAAQEKLLVGARLEHFSQVSQGVCHELGTPIGSCVTIASHIGGLCNQALQTNDETLSINNLKNTLADIQSCNEMLTRELGKSSRLLHTLKDAAQSSGLPQQNVEIDFALCIDDAWNACSEDERREISLKQFILLPRPFIGNYAALADIFKQLFRNAIDHGFVATDRPQLMVKVTPATDGGQITIEVEDNGCGMSRDIQDAALKPFFSSDRQHGKVGLGLNFVHNLVTNTLHGEMEIGGLDPGTCVRLTLPSAGD